MTISQSQLDIITVCDRIKNLLLEKNKKYGDSALNPTRLMSKASPVEQILVRIDDKLNRIQKGAGLLASDEDVVQDLAGYFILLIIALERENENNFERVKETIPSFKGLDTAWDEPDDSPFYIGRDLTRVLSPQECRELGIPETPQLNEVSEPEETEKMFFPNDSNFVENVAKLITKLGLLEPWVSDEVSKDPMVEDPWGPEAPELETLTN